MSLRTHHLRTILIGAAAIATAFAVMTPSRANAQSCVPGFEYAAFGKDCVRFGGNNYSDSWDSSTAPGTYAGTVAASGGSIGTNGTSCGATACGTPALSLGGSATTIKGDASYGPGGAACAANAGSSTITGTTTSLASEVALPSVTIPSLPNHATHGAGTTWSPSANPTVLAPGFRYGTVTSSRSLSVSAGTYVFDKLTLSGANRTLTVTSGPVVIYIAGDTSDGKTGPALAADQLSFTGSGSGINVTSGKPTDLVLFCGDNVTGAKISSAGTQGYFALYCPKTAVNIAGNSAVFGAFVGKSMKVEGGAPVHYDKALKNFAAGEFTCPAPAGTEVSRASPVVTTISNQNAIIQGTFEMPSGTAATITTTASVAGFSFPHITGHMRARVLSTVGTTATAFSSGTILFDAGATGKIPAANYIGCTSFNGSCRRIFTNTNAAATNGTTSFPTTVTLSDSTASTVGALIAPTSVVSGIGASHWTTIVRKVIAAPLGGVDRSTVAVVQASPLAGVSSRPAMAYFGGTDGMLHAVCASTGGSTPAGSNICPSLGTELWAFLPRVQLPLIRTNTARFDGSVRVVDAFGDFSNPATGVRSWRTILVVQTGFSSPATKPAAYALDVTDPASPVLLWEYTTPASAGATDFGTGLVSAAGPTLIGGQTVNLAVLHTNNGGSGGSGVVLTALDLQTGARKWQFGYAYPSAGAVPATGLPGGAVGVDMTGAGFVTDYVFGDLYGDLWRVNASNGVSTFGATTPLFRFSSTHKPIGAAPAIYSNGNTLYAAFASGGYHDQSASSWTSGTQYLIAVKLSASSTPVTEGSTSCASCDLRMRVALTSGDKGFSQALVVGNQLFVTTDSSDINASTFGTSVANTGRVVTADLSGGTSSTIVIASGAGSLVNSGTALFSSSSSKQQQLGTSAASATGTSVDLNSSTTLTRDLWIRTE
ncbi:MAG: hypothetical protein AB7P03_12710 [Kofleriaceae bacterium]